jgi:hypothetical protein
MFPENIVLFSWLNTLAMIGWALLIFAPKRWKWLLATTGIVIPCILGLIYAALMLVNFSSVEGGGYASLSQVQALMDNESVLVAGWAHYLCFDLFIGTLIARESDKIGIVRIVQIPILIVTYLFGPMGLVLFFICYGCNYALNRKVSGQ